MVFLINTPNSTKRISIPGSFAQHSTSQRYAQAVYENREAMIDSIGTYEVCFVVRVTGYSFWNGAQHVCTPLLQYDYRLVNANSAKEIYASIKQNRFL